jgi:ATP-dependent RNA circularization protein (DNA/RNA ligase family)
MVIELQPDNQAGQTDKNVPQEARVLLDELNNQLGRIYADIVVPREKVRAIVDRGQTLANQPEIWVEKEEERQEFMDILDKLDRKINQTLDLRALKAEGLVKAVKF